MREHKYRAWDKRTKQMVEVVAIVYSDFQIEAGCDDKLGDPEVDAGVWIKCNLEVVHRDFKDVELMQYTGLKDKEGKGIYEGDILRFGDYAEALDAEVVWFEDAFRIKGLSHEADIEEYLSEVNEDGKVIGSIYEDPKLLEAEEEDFHNDFHKTGGGGERQ